MDMCTGRGIQDEVFMGELFWLLDVQPLRALRGGVLCIWDFCESFAALRVVNYWGKYV